MVKIDIERLIDVKEACEILGVTRQTIYNMMQRGLVYYKFGKMVKFRVSDLEEWVQKNKKQKKP